MRLYLAAFCRPPLHTELWDYVLTLGENLQQLHQSLSAAETAASVQAFVRARLAPALDPVGEHGARLLDQLTETLS